MACIARCADCPAQRVQSVQQYLATLGDAPTARSGIQGANIGSLTKSGGNQQLAVGSPSGKVYLAPGGHKGLNSAGELDLLDCPCAGGWQLAVRLPSSSFALVPTPPYAAGSAAVLERACYWLAAGNRPAQRQGLPGAR